VGHVSAAPDAHTAPPAHVAPREVVALLGSARRVAVLTGAGMSAESGLPTFREATEGLWARYDPMTLATPDAFRSAPERVWAWYVWRRHVIANAQPHAGHAALTRIGVSRQVGVITQNVDDLHERAGNDVVAHLHGSLFSLRCFDNGHPYRGPIEEPTEQVEQLEPPACPLCGSPIRPDVVWFGEELPTDAYGAARRAILAADVLLVVGTSGQVHPAAWLPVEGRTAGVPYVEINPVTTELSDGAAAVWHAPAGIALPALADALA